MNGHFGNYGGQFVPETLMHPLEELAAAYEAAQRDPAFHAELDHLFHNYSGRPTPFISGRAADKSMERCKDLSQARGSESHRRAQDQ